MANEGKKCAHPVCSCTVALREILQRAVRSDGKTLDVACKCEHPGCRGRFNQNDTVLLAFFARQGSSRRCVFGGVVVFVLTWHFYPASFQAGGAARR